MFTIAAAMENHVYFDRGLRKIYPNLYVWIVGQGATGKSIPAEKACEMLRLLPNIFVHSGELTKMYLLNALEASVIHKQLAQPPKKGTHLRQILDPSVVIFHDELAAGVGSGEFAMDFLKHMTQMYAVPSYYDYGTDKHGLIAIERPLLNWIACTTVPWLNRAIPADIIDSGLPARVNTITAPFPDHPDEDIIFDHDKWQNLSADLLLISQLQGQFTLDQPARDQRHEQNRIAHESRRNMHDDLVQSLYGREPDQALKIAMVLSVATSDDLRITEPAMDTAFKMVNDARLASIDLFISTGTVGAVNNKMRVASIIKNAKDGLIRRGDLTSKMSRHCNADGLDLCIASLIQEGLIRSHDDRLYHGVIYQWIVKEDTNGPR